MSIPLLKKSLELANSSFIYNELKGRSKDSKENQQKLVKVTKQTKTNKNHRGIGDVKNCNINKLRQVKKKIKRTEQKLQKTLNALEYLKKPCIDKNIANIILERFNKPKVEEYIPIEEPKGTVFTEEDFKRFEECLRNEG